MRPLVRVIEGGGEGVPTPPRIRLEVVVDVVDEERLWAFAEAMHVRWFSRTEARKWRAMDPPLIEAVAEALVILNENPPDIGLEIVSIGADEISRT